VHENLAVERQGELAGRNVALVDVLLCACPEGLDRWR
jgi:hypothetical protein